MSDDGAVLIAEQIVYIERVIESMHTNPSTSRRDVDRARAALATLRTVQRKGMPK